MPTYKQFEELPAWNAATDLAVAVFKLTDAPSFRFKGDLVNQLRRTTRDGAAFWGCFAYPQCKGSRRI